MRKYSFVINTALKREACTASSLSERGWLGAGRVPFDEQSRHTFEALKTSLSVFDGRKDLEEAACNRVVTGEFVTQLPKYSVFFWPDRIVVRAVFNKEGQSGTFAANALFSVSPRVKAQTFFAFMFNWYVLQPGSIAAMAQFALSFVLLLYILSIRQRSQDTGLFLLFAITSTVYYLTAFFYFSTPEFQEQGPLYWMHQITLSVFQFSTVPMAYRFKRNAFPVEARIAYAVFAALIVVTLYFHSFGIPVNWTLYMLMIGWVVSVHLRKATLAGEVAHDDKDKSQTLKYGLRHTVNLFFHPPNRDCKAFLALAKWNIIVVVIWLNVNLMGLGFIPRPVWNPLHNSLLLVVQMYLVINFINYADVRTTFLVKLVALSLSAVLVLLGIMGFLLYQGDAGYVAENSHHALRILALLIGISTAVIVVGFPMYFRKNLLEPLNQIVAGVGKVAEGNLNVKVPVEVADEIGYLASHFNTMTDSLRNYSEEMESLVARRTEELERSIADLKAAQAQLIHAEKMASLGELTAGIAHEIQNPLNFVNNFSELNLELAEEIQADLKGGNIAGASLATASLEENLHKVVHHGKRADAIVKGMLQHSRAGTGAKEPTDMNALCEECLQLSYRALRAKDKTLQAEVKRAFDESIGKVNVVPQDIGRVLLNLFSNAFYAVAEKAKSCKDPYIPTVAVSTKGFADKVEVHVADNGGGIPESIAGKIFQPFFTTKPTGQGTGLGLSLVYDIVKAHGGETTVQTKEGEGTCFLFRLPRDNGGLSNAHKHKEEHPPVST